MTSDAGSSRPKQFASTLVAMNAISVRALRKRYRDVDAVDGVDLEIEYGEVFAILGPNGAGKTTTVEILAGHRHRDGGEVNVLGVDPWQAGLAMASRGRDRPAGRRRRG